MLLLVKQEKKHLLYNSVKILVYQSVVNNEGKIFIQFSIWQYGKTLWIKVCVCVLKEFSFHCIVAYACTRNMEW